MGPKIASFLIKNAKLVFLALAALSVVATFGIIHLESDFRDRVWFGENDPYLLAYQKYEKDFGNDDTIVVTVHSASGIFDKESVAMLKALTEDFWQIKSVTRVDSLTNHLLTENQNGVVVIEPVFTSDEPAFLASQKEKVAKNDLLRSYLINKTLDTAALYLQLKPMYDDKNQYKESVHAVQDLLKNYPNKGDHVFHVAGSAALGTAYSDISNHDLTVLTPLLVLLVFLFLAFYFRSIAASLLLLGVLGLTIFIAFGMAGWIGITYSPMTSCLPQILISITLAEGIHFLSAFFKMRHGGESKEVAAHHAIEENWTPTFMTSFTTALGFITFFTSDLKPIRDLGLLASISIMISWLFTIGVLPLVLLYIPSSVHKNFRIQKEKKHVWIHAYLKWVNIYKVPVMVVWGVLFVSSLYISSLNKVNSDLINYFSPETTIRQAHDFMHAHFGGSRGVEIVFDSGKLDGVKEISFLSKIADYQDWAREQKRITKVTSIVDIVEELNKAVDEERSAHSRLPASHQSVAQQLFLYSMSLPVGMSLNHWATLDFKKMRMKILWDIEDSEESQEQINILQDKAKELGLDAMITGKAAMRPGINHYIISTFNNASLQSLILITLCMIFLFRSWKIGLMAMIPNVIPAVFAGAIMVMLGIKYDVGTILVMSVVLGIAVDDTIHFLNAYTEEKAAGKTTYDAIVDVFDRTGSSIIMTTVVLVGSFSLALFSQFMPYVNFGMMTAVSLTLALFADLMLLPAIFFALESREKKNV